jgi:hypothetical protein
MRRLKFQRDRRSLEMFFLSYIIPILEYADVVFIYYTQYSKWTEYIKSNTKLLELSLALVNLFPWDTLECIRRKPKRIFFKETNKRNIFAQKAFVRDEVIKDMPIGDMPRAILGRIFYHLVNLNLQILTSITNVTLVVMIVIICVTIFQ